MYYNATGATKVIHYIYIIIYFIFTLFFILFYYFIIYTKKVPAPCKNANLLVNFFGERYNEINVHP